MALATIVFYLFAMLLVAAAVMVIAARNPVHSVLFLIFAFFNAAGLMVLIGAEYIAMTLVIVYVGAVAVLFLFVVMMLDVDYAALRQGFLKYLPVGAVLALLLLAELTLVFSTLKGGMHDLAPAANPTPALDMAHNTLALGRILYTKYVFLFQLAGIILLVAMIGAIVLTHRRREGVRRQVISNQVARKREDSIEIVSLKPGETGL
jgi:NADH-quinone oxidoreductase subunit J